MRGSACAYLALTCKPPCDFERKKPPDRAGRLFVIPTTSKEEQLTYSFTVLQTWQRPTLPRLETEYHQRWGVSRPSSEWDRVQPPRHSHQVSETVKDFWSSANRRKRSADYMFDEHCLMRAFKSIELLVPVSYTPCGASTPGLSTRWSSSALKGVLVLRKVSRLDAFSGYPDRT